MRQRQHKTLRVLARLGAVFSVLLISSAGGTAARADAPARLSTEAPFRTEKARAEAVFQDGIVRGWAGVAQARVLGNKLTLLSDAQLLALRLLLDRSDLEVAQVFLLKAFAAGESWENLVQYAKEMRGRSEAEIVRGSTIRGASDLRQQWEDSCAPAVVETAAGEADPRFAWELHKLGDIGAVDTTGDLAAQQKQWLEEYQGVAVPRGQTGGRGITLTEILNAKLRPIIHASYQCIAVTNVDSALESIIHTLRDGYPVPLCVLWDAGGAAVNHFLIAEAIRGQGSTQEFLLHEPWTGHTCWMSRSQLSGPFSTFGFRARLGWYYKPSPVSSHLRL